MRSVTGLDVGREVFANMEAVVAYVLPPAGAGEGSSRGRRRLPVDLGVVIKVRDPSRSEALWTQLLGLPATLLGSRGASVGTETVAGQKVRVYAFPEGIRVYQAALDDRIVLSSSAEAVERSVAAARGQGSLSSDAELSAPLAGLEGSPSKVALVHAGRAFRLVGPMTGLRGQRAQWLSGVLDGLVVSAATRESATSLRASLGVRVPDLSVLIRRAIADAGGVRHGLRSGRVVRFEPSEAVRVDAGGRAGSGHAPRSNGDATGSEARAPAGDRPRGF